MNRSINIGIVVLTAIAAGGFRSAQQSPPRLTGTIDLTLGGPDETRDPFMFNEIHGLTFDAKGRIFVVEGKQNTIRVFSPAGAYLYSIGRKGAGPADFARPCCVALDAKGRLWVEEFDNLRFSVFNIGETSAQYLWSVRTTVPPAGYEPRVAWDSLGRVMHLGSSGFGSPESFFVRYFIDSAGRVGRQDSVRRPTPEALDQFIVKKGTGISQFGVPYGPTELAAFGPRGEFATAISKTYDVTWYAPNHVAMSSARRKVEPPRLSARERRNAESVLDNIARQSGKSRAALGIGVPDSKMPLSSINFDLDGRLWVERSVVDGQPREADVFDRRGRQVATMVWPSNVQITRHGAARGQMALGVATDSLGTAAIVRLHFK